MTHYPSFKELNALGFSAQLNPKAECLFWMIQDPISAAIFVLDDMADPSGSRQPFFKQGSESSSNLHPLSQLSILERPVSSITVVVENLD